MIVRMSHVRAVRPKLCARGVRAWLVANNIDVMDFLNNGIPLNKLQTMNDAFANRVIDVALKEVTE